MHNKNNSFEINDLVIHCREGLSTIVGSKTMGDKEYFLVKVSRGSGETIYVPYDRSSDIIRHLMSVDEADELIEYIKEIKKDFNPNTKQRRDVYKRILSSGDIKQISYLARHLRFYELMDEDNKEIKLGPVDLNMLTYAENLLFDELAIVYNINRDLIKENIYLRIEK